ncbi:MAG: hypothetical protein IPF68_15925 [Bacteroidales bacterium]|nr:hypothetical protein [Bacteroidales bacterium]
MYKAISIITLALMTLSTCIGQTVSKENDPVVHPYLINTKRIKTLSGKDISYYLNNKSIDENSKLFYEGKFAISDDEKTFAICDSITTDNPDTRPFYLYVFCRIIEISDGAIAEVMGEYCTAYMIKFPCDFINNLSSEEYDLPKKEWLGFVAFEQDSKTAFENFTRLIDEKLQSGCTNSINSWTEIKREIDGFE